MKHIGLYKLKTGRWLMVLAAVVVFAGAAESRDLIGRWNNDSILLQTELLESGEYISATELINFFHGKWEYDSLSGTLRITRHDRVPVGLKIGDPRVVVGNNVRATGSPPIRYNGQVYIPFFIVIQFLMPDVQFDTPGQVAQSGVKTIEIQPTPTPFQFNYSSRTDTAVEPSSPATTPTYSPWDSLFGPSPTPVAGSSYGIIPKTVIILDPGIGNESMENQSAIDVHEKDITYRVCQSLEKILRDFPNFEVYFTRGQEAPSSFSPSQRTGIANQRQGNIFVSIQCGGLFDPNVSRAVVYFMNPILDGKTNLAALTSTRKNTSVEWNSAYQNYWNDSFRLAKSVHKRLYSFYTNANIIQMDSNPRPGRLSILRGLTMPGIVIELGNLVHATTSNRYLSRPRIQEDIAHEIAMGISDFIYERSGFQASTQ